MPFTKPNKGSVLVFSLIVLSIVLSAALSVAVVNVSNRKSAGSTGQSVQSFQVADSGVEKALKEIYKGSYTDLSTMRASITGSTACSNGSFSFPVSGGTSTVTFFDTNNAVIGCASATWRDDVAKIKVEGTSAGTTRVIETAVAAATRSIFMICSNTSSTAACIEAKSNGGAGTSNYRVVSCLDSANQIVATALSYNLSSGSTVCAPKSDNRWHYVSVSNSCMDCQDDSAIVVDLRAKY